MQTFTEIESRLVNQLTAIKFLKRKISCIPETFEERIMIYYLEKGGAVNAADAINRDGYKKVTKNGKKVYVSSDITKLIRDNANNQKIDISIRYIASEMVKRKTGYIKFQTLMLNVTYEAYERFENNGT